MTEVWEDRLQVALMLAVGAIAAAASWSHVLSLADQHGQGGWLAWAVAACIETAAVSAGLEVRRRRRTTGPTAGPLVVLVLATALQLAAQVAEAEQSPWGVTLAAVPAVTFLALAKLALSRTPRTSLVHAQVTVVQDAEQDDPADGTDEAPAGALASALAWVRDQPEPHPGPAQIMQATGVSRSTAKRALRIASTPALP